MNADELRQALEDAAGPERQASAADRDAVRRRARRGRTRRVAWVSALLVVLVGATTIGVRALDSSTEPTVVAPSGSSASDWAPFCAQVARIQAAAETGADADPSLTDFHGRYDRLVHLAPTDTLRRAMRTARPDVEVRPQGPPASAQPALRTLDRALADHCGRSFADVFKIGDAFLLAPNVDARVTPVDLGSLQPREMLATGDAIWLMVPRSTDPGAGCDLGRVDPLTGDLSTSPLPACGFNGVVAADGTLDFESDTPVPNTNTHELRILKVDTTTRAAQVLDPVVMRVEGSSIAHTQLAFADGSLWLWGSVGQDEIHQVSPATGDVERVITGMPQIGGIEPLMAATPGQLWLSGGPGGGTTLARLDTATGASSPGPTLDPTPGTIPWLAARDGELFVSVLGTSGAGPSTRGRVSVLGADGATARTKDGKPLGGEAVGSDDAVWLLGASDSCTRVPLARLDPVSLVSTEVFTFSGSTSSCIGGGDRRLAVLGPHVFVLDQGLYRVTP